MSSVIKLEFPMLLAVSLSYISLESPKFVSDKVLFVRK